MFISASNTQHVHLFISARTISEDWSSSGDSRNEEEDRERKSPKDKDGKEKEKDSECKTMFKGSHTTLINGV